MSPRPSRRYEWERGHAIARELEDSYFSGLAYEHIEVELDVANLVAEYATCGSHKIRLGFGASRAELRKLVAALAALTVPITAAIPSSGEEDD